MCASKSTKSVCSSMKSAKRSVSMRALLLCLSMLAVTALAEPYPKKAIRLIVPFGPGSGSDVIARTLGRYLQERWQQAVVIDNRPGANGIIGATALKNASADGYTLGVSTLKKHLSTG
jgi:tripartite-type tricarboxylate transporter receptor subunit TctC